MHNIICEWPLMKKRLSSRFLAAGCRMRRFKVYIWTEIKQIKLRLYRVCPYSPKAEVQMNALARTKMVW